MVIRKPSVTFCLCFFIAILNCGWDLSEREDGESSTHEKNDRVTDNLSNWDTVPNIEPYYNGNTRYAYVFANFGDKNNVAMTKDVSIDHEMCIVYLLFSCIFCP